MADASIGVSVVSHRHAGLVPGLLADLANCPEIGRIILTENVPDEPIAVPATLAGRVTLLRNRRPRGFASNHNAAFEHIDSPFYCVVNPDIRMPSNPFPALLDCFAETSVALCAPAVLNPRLALEDSARRYPTPIGLLIKAIGGADGRYSFALGGNPVYPDWIAGMFLLLRSQAFRAIGGFDAGFHLYYEDVDLCVRLRNAGYQLLVFPRAQVMHNAQRASHRSARYLAWHLQSLSRYFRKHLGRLPKRPGD